MAFKYNIGDKVKYIGNKKYEYPDVLIIKKRDYSYHSALLDEVEDIYWFVGEPLHNRGLYEHELTFVQPKSIKEFM